MQDTVRLYKPGDEGRLLARNIRRKENAKASLIPKKQQECTGRRRWNHSHQTKHESSSSVLVKQGTSVIIVQTFSTAWTHFPNNEESDDCGNAKVEEAYPVYQELCPVPHAETLKVPVESDWADDKETRQRCRGGAVLFHGCAVLAWARTQRSNPSLGSSTIFARMAVQNSTASRDRRTERTCGAIEESLVA